jgi:FMN-dependent NADH-azoreductase
MLWTPPLTETQAFHVRRRTATYHPQNRLRSRHIGSVSRKLADELVNRLATPGTRVVRRDVSSGLPFVSAEWVGAAFAGADPSALAHSDELVDELLTATEIVLVAPVYNFGIPAAMKAWVDQVCRAGRTFRFTETGPEGLVHAERAWIVTASGGTVIGSPVDFNTGYLRAILGFLGVHDVRVVAAEQLQLVGEAGVAKAYAELDTHALI